MWPIRTTSVMRRSCSSSPSDTMAQWYIDGHTVGSRRSRFWSASSRVKRSSSEAASVIAVIRVPTDALSCLANCGPGWMLARLSSQESRGMIQRSPSAGTPLRSSQRQQSIPVLPPPTIV